MRDPTVDLRTSRPEPDDLLEARMKAARFREFGGPEVLEIADLPDPHAGPGQVRIVVHAAGVSATDTKVRSGALRVDDVLPQTIGRDVAGVVDEIGEGVTDVACQPLCSEYQGMLAYFQACS